MNHVGYRIISSDVGTRRRVVRPDEQRKFDSRLVMDRGYPNSGFWVLGVENFLKCENSDRWCQRRIVYGT